MRKIKVEEIKGISGGSITYSAAFLGVCVKIVDILFDVGQNLGSAIRRSSSSDICQLK